MSKIAVIAKLTTNAGMRDEVVSVLSAQVQAVADEAGTEVYALHVDTADEVTVWFYELYADKAALDFHGTTDAMKALGPKLAGKLAGRPELSILSPVVAKGL